MPTRPCLEFRSETESTDHLDVVDRFPDPFSLIRDRILGQNFGISTEVLRDFPQSFKQSILNRNKSIPHLL
jgi:hypothetical protein